MITDGLLQQTELPPTSLRCLGTPQTYLPSGARMMTRIGFSSTDSYSMLISRVKCGVHKVTAQNTPLAHKFTSKAENRI